MTLRRRGLLVAGSGGAPARREEVCAGSYAVLVAGFAGGLILRRGDAIVARLDRRAYSPVLRQAVLPETAVPWWGGRHLRFEYA